MFFVFVGKAQDIFQVKAEKYLFLKNTRPNSLYLDATGLYFQKDNCRSHISTDSLYKLQRFYYAQQEAQQKKLVLLFLRNAFFGLPKYTGLRIALDPGHFAGDWATAQIEGKYLKMTLPDSTEITFFESSLAWATAKILADSLKKHGAQVLLTRSKPYYTAFEKTFGDMYAEYLQNFAQKKQGKKSIRKNTQPSPALFFKKQFRKQELLERVRKINAFQPDFTIIIHYNVDENNKPWNKPTHQNFAIAFVAGAFEDKDFQQETDMKHFIRLLCSFQIERSIQLAEKILEAHEKIANVPIVPLLNDQPFLQKYCLWTGSKGVYARNLMLCREIEGIVCYGESLLQDSEQEIRKLNEKTLQIDELYTSPRVLDIARAYWHGICNFLW